MKIISNNTKHGYSKGVLRQHANVLDKICFGYKEDKMYSKGYIEALHKNKLINNCEKKWLTKIYVDEILSDDGQAGRYVINKKGEVEDYNGDEID